MKPIFAALLFFALASWAHVQASTIHVAGDQSGICSADTVIVTGDVRVPPCQSLTILPGVDVLFQAHDRLIVENNATLLASDSRLKRRMSRIIR